MLEGKNVNVRACEEEELSIVEDWFNNPEIIGEYFSPHQRSRVEMRESKKVNPFENKHFFIEKKDGSKIGYLTHFYWIHFS